MGTPRLLQRDRLGWLVLLLGTGLCALGWYGVAGERLTARQLPYLASATAPGVALLLGGIILLATARPAPTAPAAAEPRPVDPELDQILRQLELLYRLLTEEATLGAATAAVTDAKLPSALLLAVPGGGTYHRQECLLVQGRQDALPITSATVAQRGLRPCPLCEPLPLPAGGGSPYGGR